MFFKAGRNRTFGIKNAVFSVVGTRLVEAGAIEIVDLAQLGEPITSSFVVVNGSTVGLRSMWARTARAPARVGLRNTCG